MKSIADIFIVGGGINGTAIAADAAGRGLDVVLCEKGDLASATSSASSCLIHGGLRYLEQFEFRLVREALNEREIILRKSPHITKPLQFIMPYHRMMRPKWLIRLGLLLYDFLGRRQSLPAASVLDLQKLPAGKNLHEHFKHGFSYYDCWTNDARLVISNAMSARQNRATILPYHDCIAVQRLENHWNITVQGTQTQQCKKFKAKVLVNAAGPWAAKFLREIVRHESHEKLHLIKGSHIIVSKLYSGDYAYLLQHSDRRVIFVLPYQEHYNLIGTTDVKYQGSLDNIQISADEIEYLCDIINHYFKKSITIGDIVSSYAGVRPLRASNKKDPSGLSRDYELTLQANDKQAALLSVFGGKLTTHRKLAEHAINKLKPLFAVIGPSWTSTAKLPGADINAHSMKDFFCTMQQKYAWLPVTLLQRYVHTYGSLVSLMLEDCVSLQDMGQCFGSQLYQREVEYLLKYEWAQTVDDIIDRRTSLLLEFNEANKFALERFIKNHQTIV